MKNKFKIFVIFIGCLLFRLIPLRAPNVEPIMASVMPLGRRYGALAGFLFGFLSIFLYDAITHFGAWTWITAITYGVIGAFSSFYFDKRGARERVISFTTSESTSNQKVNTFYFQKFKPSAFGFAIFAFGATIFFDLITGVFFAPMFGQTIWNAFVLQIPFTALHLAGNIGFAFTLSPLIDKWLATERFFALKTIARVSRNSLP